MSCATLQESHQSHSIQILRISIHFASGTLDSKPEFKGRHARVSLRVSQINLQELLQAEIDGDHQQYIDGKIEHRTGREWADMLVAGESAYRSIHLAKRLHLYSLGSRLPAR